MTEERSEYAEPLLIEWFARRFRFDRLAAALPGDLYPPYLLVGVALFIDYGVFDIYNYFITGKSIPLTDPGSLGISVGVLFAIVALRRLELSRREAIESLHELEYSETNSTASELFAPVRQLRRRVMLSLCTPGATTRFTPTVPLCIKFVTYLVGLTVFYQNLFADPGFGKIVEIEGFVVAVSLGFVVIPLVYVPLIIDVIVLCLGVSLFFSVRYFVPTQIYSTTAHDGSVVSRVLVRHYGDHISCIFLDFHCILGYCIFKNTV